MALIDNDQEFLRKIVNQRVGRAACGKAGQITGIVFDAGAETGLPHHFNIKGSTFTEPLGFHQLILMPEIQHPFLQILFNLLRSVHHLFMRNDVV